MYSPSAFVPSSESSQEVLIRDPKEFSEPLRMALDQITINEVPRVVGSAAFLVHRYPSDVDVFEKVTVNLSREDALNFYVDQFQNIMERILVNSKEIKFSDFKAGVDSRFDFDIPDTSTVDQRRRAAVTLAREIDLPEMTAIKLYKRADDIEKYREVLRDLKTLRWTPNEIIQGYKYLIDGTKITLKEALEMNTIVKLDVIVWISGRFQSVEAFYNLRYTDPATGKTTDFYPLGNYVRSLLEDIEKYSGKKYYSPLKVAKRLWSLSRVTQCEDLLTALSPLMGSDMAALNQIKSDAEVLQNLIRINDLTNNQIIQIFLEILTFHKRAANHLSGDNYQKFEQLIDLAFPLWEMWKSGRGFDTYRLNNLLSEVQKLLKPIINQRSEEFLRQVDRLNITCRNPRFREVQGFPTSSPYNQA